LHWFRIGCGGEYDRKRGHACAAVDASVVHLDVDREAAALGNNCQGRTRNLGCGVPAGFDGNERIVCTVKDKGRKGKLLEHLDARAAGHDRGELTSCSRRIVGSVEGRADLGS
jgi:hypothetical protein